MAKNKKSARTLLNPEDVIAGRIRPDARELVSLIHAVNPTGLGLDRKETARRYAIKSRLQSLLILRFPGEIEAMAEPDESGIVALRHRPFDLDACHALLAELDDDARSIIQHMIDTHGNDKYSLFEPNGDVSSASRIRRGRARSGVSSIQTLLNEGHAALEAYDYELARARFDEALAHDNGDQRAARALLSLLVEQLGADEEALAIQEQLDAAAFADGTVCGLLAIAAARFGDRRRALEFIEDRGSKIAARHVADVFMYLAKNALAIGEFKQAATDFAHAKEYTGTHPEFAMFLDALSKSRAAARGPAEAKITSLMAEGHIREAEERAQELLAQFPESEIARRVQSTIDEQKKRSQAKAQFDEARKALARLDGIRANSLLRSALAIGLPAEEAAWAEASLEAMEHEERGRAEQARVAETIRLLDSNELSKGLSFYSSLPTMGRREVNARFGLPVFSWLDELFPPGESGKADAVIAAILGLHRAMEILSHEPALAIERLAAHDKVLRGFGPAEEVRQAASVAHAKQLRQVALSRVDAARHALADDQLQQADRLLTDVVQKHLREDEIKGLVELRRRIENALERQTNETIIEQHRRQNDPVRALAIAKKLVARTDGEDAARIADICAALDAEIRKAFSVRVEHAKDGGHGAWSGLQDARIMPKWKWGTMVSDPHGGPDDFHLIIPQTRAEWLFIRVVDMTSGEVRTRVTLRTPIAIDVIYAIPRYRQLLLVGRAGAFLVIDVDDWSVLQWSNNILSNHDGATPVETVIPELDLITTAFVVESASMSTDCRYLWVNVYYREQRERIVHIFEIDGMRPVRDIRDQVGARINCRAIIGLERTCMVITNEDEELSLQKTTFYDPRGKRLEEWSLSIGMTAPTLVACPDGKHIFGATSDPYGPKDPHTVAWGFCEIGAGGAAPFHVLADVTAIYHATAVVSLDEKMCFLLFWVRDHCELFGFHEGLAGLEVAYRVRVPRYSTLFATPDGRRAAMLIVYENGHEIVRLGPTPPKFDNAEDGSPFVVPSIPRSSVQSKHYDCYEPTGVHLASVITVENELRRLGRSRYLERVQQALKKGDPDELLAMVQALLRLREPTFAGKLNSRLDKAFADHPRVRLSYTRPLATVGRWQEVLAKLEGIDSTELVESEAKHFHHMRGIALMMLDDPETAVVEFDRGAAYQQGSCAMEELVALCVPLSDTRRSWGKEASVLRDWLRCIAAADAALERGDGPSARRAIDVRLIWEANEVQSFGRMAAAYLSEDEQSKTIDPFRKGLVLGAFCELVDARRKITRREVPLPGATWGSDKLADLEQKARQWLDMALGNG